MLTAMDAKVEASPDEGRSTPVEARVETSGSTPELVFTPDEKFLADPAVTYPVTIAAADDWFGGGRPTDAWVGKNTGGNNAAAGYLRADTTSTTADIARLYLKFNTEDPVLEGATVVDADLWVWNYKSGGPNNVNCGDPMGGSGMGARRITTSWDTSTLSWSRQPTLANVEGESGNKAGYNYEAEPLRPAGAPRKSIWCTGSPTWPAPGLSGTSPTTGWCSRPSARPPRSTGASTTPATTAARTTRATDTRLPSSSSTSRASRST
ncbi:hypothetical protein [Nonomuraea sp. NPDC003709]|uniref:hypothetical protein n=1 Tax=Nonomuraea sp. NPDC003709 TaxID=3154450 RepID=UPI0033A2316F